ncbi:MAG: hypothetical protein OEY64_06730 [Nitrospinota bacterium]|nr:hypothetical protein [Nitrospinota bacterium]
MDILSKCKLITCILPKGKAVDIEKKLHRDKGIDSTNVWNGRGSGTKRSTLQSEIEVEIISIVVDESRADEIFEFIYHEADIGAVSSGFMYQMNLRKSSRFLLPDIAEEKF